MERPNLLREVIENGCRYASETNGDAHCFYCEAMIDYEEHSNDCLYIRIENAVKTTQPQRCDMLTPEEKKQLHEKWKLTKGARWTKIEVDKSKLGNADQKEPIWLMVNHEVIPKMTRANPYTIIASSDEYGLDRLAVRIDEFNGEEYELYVYANPQATIYFLWNEA